MCECGFTGDGFVCRDEDECLTTSHKCDAYAKCVNTPGSYECQCQDGYKGNGIMIGQQDGCYDINECQGMAHGCSPFAICTNDFGIFHCDCEYGYTGNGTYCEDFDECLFNTHTCPYDSNCVNVNGAFVCHCMEGFIDAYNSSMLRSCPYGVNCPDYCDDIDECVDMKRYDVQCPVDKQCSNTWGSYTCECALGFKPDENGCTGQLKLLPRLVSLCGCFRH